MRYFFEDELGRLFGDAGLDLCALHPFDDLGGVPDTASWNVWACARAHGTP
jgi:hypothetical protein